MNDNASQSPPHHDSNPNSTTDVKPDDNHSPTVHASGPPVSESQARVSRNGNPDDVAVASSDVFRVRVSSDGDDGSTSNTSTIDRRFPGSDSKSLFSEFDDYVAADRSSSGVQRDLGYGFEIGDMVWGKVKSHPWWPGHIYNEAFATSSVRRTKREGHVLVAFFGDSSYGWFEPAELIPFDANFAEKSQQLHSRTFLKAVEEAVDEASRRRGLGLTCKCRNSDNFRAADVKGYFSVDVLDYEPGGFYSDGQIRKARDSFVPSETLDFVRELALAPHDGEHGSIGFVKNKATVSAYRKAVFEQYDETYAQAFGVQPSRPSRPQNLPHNQPARQPPRAPLSGPMVIAEALGGGKSATKSAKVKDSSKKDRYLFKRRDDPSNSLQLENKEETPDADGHYVFQKRAPPVPVMPHNSEKHTDTGFVSHDGVTSTSDVKEGLIGQVQADSSSLTSQAISLDAKPHLDKGKESSEEMTRSIKQDNILSENMGGSNLSGELALQRSVDEPSKPSHPESNISMNVKHDWNVKLPEPCDEPSIADGGNDLHQVKTKNNLHNPPIEAKHHKISAVKNIKGHKRPADDMNSNSSVTEERKKKKKKKPNLQPMSDPQEKHRTAGKFSGNLKAKPLSTTSAPKEDFPTEKLPVDVDARNLLPMDTSEDVNFELPQLLGDLQALALNPFHGIERKIPAAVLLFFLRFRSLVYQKSLVLSPPTENEAPEVRVIKSPLGVRVSDNPEDHIKALPIIKPVKHVRLDDPTKAGRKRAPSDRQEEIAAKRVKKIKDIKTLAAEKAAASQKTSDARREDAKEPVSQAPSKFAKPESAKEPVSQAPSRLGRPDSAKRVDRPAKVVEPTTLVIKFPPGTSLPSVAELKARFARFGQMDQSGFRVFWKSSTCRVVFLFKADAQAAYKFCVANQSLFGSVGVRCFLRESGDSAPEVSEATKVRGDDGSNETPRVKDPAVSSHKPLSQPAIQLKSILKKSTGDESGQVTGNGNSSSSSSKGNPRVKFVLGGEESSSKGEQLMVGSRNFNNASFADGGAMDFNSKNVQKVASQPPLLPTPPLATQFTKSQQHNLRNSDLAMAPRNIPNFINTTTTTASVATVPSVDISQQMISLLTRCNDVVTNLTGLLGYVPYHPL